MQQFLTFLVSLTLNIAFSATGKFNRYENSDSEEDEEENIEEINTAESESEIDSSDDDNIKENETTMNSSSGSSSGSESDKENKNSQKTLDEEETKDKVIERPSSNHSSRSRSTSSSSSRSSSSSSSSSSSTTSSSDSVSSSESSSSSHDSSEEKTVSQLPDAAKSSSQRTPMSPVSKSERSRKSAKVTGSESDSEKKRDRIVSSPPRPVKNNSHHQRSEDRKHINKMYNQNVHERIENDRHSRRDAVSVGDRYKDSNRTREHQKPLREDTRRDDTHLKYQRNHKEFRSHSKDSSSQKDKNHSNVSREKSVKDSRESMKRYDSINPRDRRQFKQSNDAVDEGKYKANERTRGDKGHKDDSSRMHRKDSSFIDRRPTRKRDNVALRERRRSVKKIEKADPSDLIHSSDSSFEEDAETAKKSFDDDSDSSDEGRISKFTNSSESKPVSVKQNRPYMETIERGQRSKPRTAYLDQRHTNRNRSYRQEKNSLDRPNRRISEERSFRKSRKTDKRFPERGIEKYASDSESEKEKTSSVVVKPATETRKEESSDSIGKGKDLSEAKKDEILKAIEKINRKLAAKHKTGMKTSSEILANSEDVIQKESVHL